MLILQSWFCRLGNNILQLCRIINIAIVYKHNIIFKVGHPLFNLKLIEEYFNKYDNKVVYKGNFFMDNKNIHYPEVSEQDVEERNNLLKKSFLIKDINKLDEDDLIIHIRSGDIFSTYPHRGYAPPPLSYYVKQINKIQHKKIIIISEDTKNPVVNKLLELYKNAEYKKQNLHDDIKIILGTTKIIHSVGTFVPYLLVLSDNIKVIYGFDGIFFNTKREPLYNTNSDNIKIGDILHWETIKKDYFTIMKPWKNTKAQRDYILNYDYNEN